VPIFEQLVDFLETDITTKVFPVGSQLSPEPILSKRYKVSRGTMRKALLFLEEKGVVARRKGKGTFVTDPHIRKKKNSLALVYFGDLKDSHSYFGEIISALETAVGNGQFSTFRYRNNDNIQTIKKSFDGIFVMRPYDNPTYKKIMELQQIGIPAVMIGAYKKETGMPKVLVDNYRGAYLATEYLIQNGHVHIAFMQGLGNRVSGEERSRGFIQALQDYGIDYKEEMIIRTNGSGTSLGFQTFSEIIRGGTLPTALFACTDLLAIGAMKAIRNAGLRIPRDISVMGFDDISLAEYVEPPLSTVRCDMSKISEVAVAMLNKLIRGNPVERQVAIPVELVPRETTGKRKP